MATDFVMGDTTLEAGSRALMVYASANRDERKWPDPERFDVTRRPSEHLAFGHGTHMCAGMHLAKLELTVMLTSLARRVKTDGANLGSFMILEAKRLEDVVRFHEDDPFTKAELFSQVIMHRWERHIGG